MFVHSVYFWLKSDVDRDANKAFEDGLNELNSISAVKAVYVGRPAQTSRPVIDSTYDFALTVVLRDLQAHDEYQVDPIHKAFLAKFGQMIDKVLIYDAD